MNIFATIAETATPVDDPIVAFYCLYTKPVLPAQTRSVFREIGRYLDPSDPQSCSPSHDQIAEATGLSRSQIRTAIANLEYAGLVSVHQKPGAPGRSNVYIFDHGIASGFQPAAASLSLSGNKIQQNLALQAILLGIKPGLSPPD